MSRATRPFLLVLTVAAVVAALVVIAAGEPEVGSAGPTDGLGPSFGVSEDQPLALSSDPQDWRILLKTSLGDLPKAGNVVVTAMYRLNNSSGQKRVVECSFYDGDNDVNTRRGLGRGETGRLKTILAGPDGDDIVSLTNRWAVPAGPRQIALRCAVDKSFNMEVDERSMTVILTE